MSYINKSLKYRYCHINQYIFLIYLNPHYNDIPKITNNEIQTINMSFNLQIRYDMGRKGSGSGTSGIRLLAVTLRHLFNKYQLLLLPITMFIGAAQVTLKFTLKIQFNPFFVFFNLIINFTSILRRS